METMTTHAAPQDILHPWLVELQINDHAPGTIRRYKSAVESFLQWYAQEEHQEVSPVGEVCIKIRTLLQPNRTSVPKSNGQAHFPGTTDSRKS
jgi:hypothetical protein